MPDPSVHLHLHRMLALGLNTYEAKAYLAMVLRQSWVAGELATQAGIPRQRIYDVLARLVERGLALDRPGRVTRFSAVDPDTAIQRLIAVQRQELDELSTRSQDLALTLRRTWERGQDVPAAEVRVEVLREPALATVRAREVVESATSELCVLAPASGPLRLPDASSVARVLHAGGTVRLLLQSGPAGDLTDDLTDDLAAGREAGADVRVVDHAPLGLVLADRRTVVICLDSADDATDLVVEHEALAASLQLTFDHSWEQAKEVP